ncbi:cytochrome c oxidase subunit II [Adhaeribacter aquaticus]|uniref:cytochrome c oxidase subunit II n=1 Tax=Adhaeribacter aquaticus TaxID=299567 RepID=UPI00047D99CE|nr:cytochrome c oxidase subunit II [Adhaeribacter aquaticus]
MITLAILFTLALLGVILYLIFRIQILGSVYRGTYNKRVSTSNKVNATLFVVFLIVGGGAFFWSFQDAKPEMTVPVASVHGAWVNDMFWLTMAVIGIVFVITQVLLFYYSYKYQFREDKTAYYYPHNNKLEIIWTIIPAIVMAMLVFSGWKAWTKITNPAPADAVVVEITGKQFNWLFRYPGKDNALGLAKHTLIDASNEIGIDFNDKKAHDDIIVNEIHIPKGRPVLFRIRSRDVIHDVYQPNFRVQMHAVPGMPTKFWFVPTKTTAEMAEETGNPDFKYELVCSQICGRGHFAMRGTLVVDEPEDYEAWLAKEQPFLEKNPDLLAKFKNAPVQVVTAGNEKGKIEEKAAL